MYNSRAQLEELFHSSLPIIYVCSIKIQQTKITARCHQSYHSLNISQVKLPQMLHNLLLKGCKIKTEQALMAS